jgi:hypothetical protein
VSWALRVNPSSGNLHPTEGYLLCGPVVELTKGVLLASDFAGIHDPREAQRSSGDGDGMVFHRVVDDLMARQKSY